MMVRFESVVLFVRDIPSSRRFYEGLLGQKVAMDHGLNVGYDAGFALWQADHASQTIFGKAPIDGRLGHQNLEVYFESEELESVWQTLAEAKVEVVHPIREQPWGQQVFRVADPDGHVVEVGEPMTAVIGRLLREELTVEQIAARTSMPLEVVREMVLAKSEG